MPNHQAMRWKMACLALLLLLLYLKEGHTQRRNPDKRPNSSRIVIDVFKPACLTPTEHPGQCVSLQECPSLAFNTRLIRNSLCFRLFFIPGVCCPTQMISSSDQSPEPSASAPSTVVNDLFLNTTAKNPIHPFLEVSTAPSFIDNLTTTKNGCGKNVIFTMRVVGGEKSFAGQWPWMAAIFVEGRRRKEYWCGGTLITDRHILTAAHCMRDAKQNRFNPRQLTVRLGTHDLHHPDRSNTIDINVEEIRMHPQFRAQGFYNDIAILRLGRPVLFSDSVKPVCLPTAAMRSENTVGEFATIAGWGSTFYGGSESGILRQTELPIWDNADCDRVFTQKIENIFVCAGLADGGKDACQGDSGSPMMILRDSRWVQYGIVSFGEKCAQAGSPGVYTRITEFLDWINDNAT